MITCDSCGKPIEGARPPLSRRLQRALDRHGRAVAEGTATDGAYLDITVFGELHDECVRPRLDAVLEMAIANGLDL